MHWTSLASPLAFAWPAVDNDYRHLPHITAKPDLAYIASDHPMQRLDLFAPPEAQGAPVVVFFRGDALLGARLPAVVGAPSLRAPRRPRRARGPRRQGREWAPNEPRIADPSRAHMLGSA